MSANCTKVVARHEAGAVDVCRVASTIALHFSTPAGIVLIRMRERDFIQGARGPVDYHGHPFRTAGQLDAEKGLLVGALNDASSPELRVER